MESVSGQATCNCSAHWRLLEEVDNGTVLRPQPLRHCSVRDRAPDDDASLECDPTPDRELKDRTR